MLGAGVTTPLLQVRELTKHFPITGGPAGIRTIGQVRAVDGVSFDLAEGETLALVGESGCGKSTTGRMLLRLTEPTSGRIAFGGDDLLRLGRAALRRRRREMQIVFQDPYASLSPRQHVEDIVAEPLDVYRLCTSHSERRDRVSELLRLVGLDATHLRRYPFEFSGGQRQRIAIARALASQPKMKLWTRVGDIVCSIVRRAVGLDRVCARPLSCATTADEMTNPAGAMPSTVPASLAAGAEAR